MFVFRFFLCPFYLRDIFDDDGGCCVCSVCAVFDAHDMCVCAWFAFNAIDTIGYGVDAREILCVCRQIGCFFPIAEELAISDNRMALNTKCG